MRDMVKWGVKSVGGLGANVALLTLWVDVVGLHPAVAIVPNFFLISIAGYVVTSRWIWPDGVQPCGLGHVWQWAGMQASQLTGKAANYVLFLVMLPVVDYRLAWVIGAVATFGITFVMNRWWWTREKSEVAERSELV